MTRTPGRLLIIFGVCCILAVVYALFDPSETVWMPKCPVHLLTGYDCPGCGSQRALHALLHGDLAGVWHANAILFIFLPLIMMMGVAELLKQKRPGFYRAVCHPALIAGIIVLLVGWTLLRNLLSL